MKRHPLAASFAYAFTVILALSGPATAGEPVPFKGRFEGTLTSRTPIGPGVVFDHFDITGNATHLGRFKLVIEAVVDFTTLPPTGAGTCTLTSADGDTLVADFTGSSALVEPGVVLITEYAIVDPDGSTGRFAGAAGNFTLEHLFDAATGVTGVTFGTLEGTISLPAANHP